MLLEDYLFAAGMIEEQEAQASRDRLEAITFGAWQMLRMQGLKTSWKKYRAAYLGDAEQVDREEAETARQTAAQIIARLGAKKT